MTNQDFENTQAQAQAQTSNVTSGFMQVQPQHQDCPHCGRCPQCGRGGHQTSYYGPDFYGNYQGTNYPIDPQTIVGNSFGL